MRRGCAILGGVRGRAGGRAGGGGGGAVGGSQVRGAVPGHPRHVAVRPQGRRRQLGDAALRGPPRPGGGATRSRPDLRGECGARKCDLKGGRVSKCKL